MNPGLTSIPARVRQAARADGPPDTMRMLAQDPDLIVRASVAINPGCPPDIDAILAGDADERVRALLAARIARLVPDLDQFGQDRAAQHIVSTLSGLARDHASRVRAAIADEIKAMDAAPHDLVMLLASDEAIEVSDPVLRLSPVLTDSDLLKLLATPPNSRSAEAIAGRAQLSATVASAIVAYAEEPAIRALLANRSACIQEVTLDALVGQAPYHLDWHDPLVRRPSLSVNAIRALSTFIAADLLRVLVARNDLDAEKLDAVRQRLAAEHAASGDEEPMIADAQFRKNIGTLSEEMLLEAVNIGHVRRVVILLAVAAGVTLRCVERVIELRSAKALVSLAWRAGFSMRAGTAVQASLAQFSPDHALLPTVNGNFPLSTEEMEWQLELMQAVELQPAA